MKTLTFALLLAAMTLMAQDRTWPQEPTSFRSVPFGATEKEAKKIVKTGLCFTLEADRGCSADFDLAGVQISSIMVFRADQLGRVQAKFPSSSFSSVRTVFIDKYGEPQSDKESTVQNNAGASFNQETLEWNGPNIFLQLKRYGSTISEGAFVVQTQKMLQDIYRDADAKRSKAKDDL